MPATARNDPGTGLYGSTVGANMLRAGIAESIGTFVLVLAGTAVATSALLDRPTAGAVYDSLAIALALAFGLALVALAAALGHVSGAHLNPAVTLGLATTGKFPWRYVPTYVLCQLGGAIAGAMGTWLLFGAAGRNDANLAATYPQSGVGSLQALLVEGLITFVLVFVVVSVATDERATASAAPLAVGLALAVGVMIGGPVTGGAVNPARALGPMIVAGNFTAFWVYIVGPVVGGVIAALVYDKFLADAVVPEEAEEMT